MIKRPEQPPKKWCPWDAQGMRAEQFDWRSMDSLKCSRLQKFCYFFMKNITLVMTLSPEFWLFQTMLSQQPYMFDMWFFRYFWITFQEHLIYVVQSDILCCWIFTDHCIFFLLNPLSCLLLISDKLTQNLSTWFS